MRSGLWIGDYEIHRVDAERAVGVVQQMRLPQHVAGQVLDEDEAAFGEFLPVDIHVAKFRAARLLVARAEGCIALECARCVDRGARLLKLRIRRIRVAAADGDDMQAFVARHHVLGRAVQVRIGESEDFEVALAKHGAMIA